MGANSSISWCHHTFNCWWGCVEVPGSPACAHCYAREWAARFGTQWGKETPRRFFDDKHWNEPLKWNRKAAKNGTRYRVFCASMADVFEDRRDLDPQRERLWKLIDATPHLDWLLLTKRPQNWSLFTPSAWADRWPSNVWFGATVENQRWVDERLPHLFTANAVVYFVSAEPLHEPLDLSNFIKQPWMPDRIVKPRSVPVEYMPVRGLNWVVTGGESGRKAKPSHPDVFTSLRDQCVAAGVAFHFKQWGEWIPDREVAYSPASYPGADTCLRSAVKSPAGSLVDAAVLRVGKKLAGHLLEGREWLEFPQPAELFA